MFSNARMQADKPWSDTRRDEGGPIGKKESACLDERDPENDRKTTDNMTPSYKIII